MKRPHRLISYKGDIENSDSSVWVETSQISTRIASCDIDQYWKISQEFELLQWDGFKDISVASKVAKYYGKKYPKRKYDTSLNFTISKWWLLLFIYWSTHVVVVLQNIRTRFPPDLTAWSPRERYLALTVLKFVLPDYLSIPPPLRRAPPNHQSTIFLFRLCS